MNRKILHEELSKNKRIKKDKLLFLLMLNDRAKEEESAYARMLFQENILLIFLIATLKTIELFLNKKIGGFVLTKERKVRVEQTLEIEFETQKLETKTLGQLFAVVKPFLMGNQNLKSLIDDFIGMRNDITHNMFLKYKDMNQLEVDSKEVVKIGEEAIKELNIFRNNLLEAHEGN